MNVGSARRRAATARRAAWGRHMHRQRVRRRLHRCTSAVRRRDAVPDWSFISFWSRVSTRTLRSVLNANAVNALRDRIQAEIDDGHSNAAQFALAIDSEVVAAESYGTAADDSR